ncbi:sulfur carrier protein ThiS adenylyltransferase ThiF [Ruminococcus flavefaciens]|uniref:sulfur carrier protein ThiS adenylyltransferase ThiF n=1 Tax=Ruminococcus flavefaciens TaxID=1265 RepID=UPI0026EC776A|nr:sulfur carrier protein ThiS adenylyltransferase ThiF [Ruminococcus flavefaciens]MDD7516161.1 sulfur carrier protein ThiS adenylyltransferase ThiF [Ruminococcus flavefaciens]MDY5692422.1 sulfur carrier protein ThiS adenylyltransferase ThiF [Ruminococcus flavefaciens]
MIPTKEEMYAALEERHGAELQRKLSEASVAVCGLGGLGSNIAIALVRAGVGKLHIMDFDRVDISNLNRQQYFPEQLGQYKADALYDTLKRIAPYCEIVKEQVKLDEDNIPKLLADDDIIVEAFDKADQKAMLVNCVLEELPEKYLVSGSGMAGIAPSNMITTKKITKRFYICGDGVSDVADGMGLVSSRVLICAGHQAHAVIRIIAGEYDI